MAQPRKFWNGKVIWLKRLFPGIEGNPFQYNGPFTRYVTLRVAHAPRMPGVFSPLLLVSDPDMHHGTCVTHVPGYMPESLTSHFLWSRHTRRVRNPHSYISGKRPMGLRKQSQCSHLSQMFHIATWNHPDPKPRLHIYQHTTWIFIYNMVTYMYLSCVKQSVIFKEI